MTHLMERKRPRCGVSPVMISHRTTPSENKSHFSVQRSPIRISGAVQVKVPALGPQLRFIWRQVFLMLHQMGGIEAKLTNGLLVH
jgi:hypothetical protein